MIHLGVTRWRAARRREVQRFTDPGPYDIDDPAAALMAEPAAGDVAALLRRIAGDPTVLAELGRKARQEALRWSWRAAARALLGELDPHARGRDVGSFGAE